MASLLAVDEVASLVKQGRRLWLAGDESVLRQIPKGSWIAGTIPYFMSAAGGEFRRDRIFVTELPAYVEQARVKLYGADELARMTSDAFDYGVSFIIIPAESPAHLRFAEDAPTYRDILLKPFVGWIAGVAVEDLGKVAAKVLDGETGESSESKAVVMHLALPRTKTVRVDIVNIFEQGPGDEIAFEKSGFTVDECKVNGRTVRLADYLLDHAIDTRLPLVADYSGAMINTSFQSVDRAGGVKLYAPVFAGLHYKIARPVADYASEFQRRTRQAPGDAVFSCNCILNYLHGKLEGKPSGSFVGPVTFGEIAYQLLNQTLVYVEIRDAQPS